MHDEEYFRKLLNQARREAAGSGGRIERARAAEIFNKLDLTGSQMQMVYQYLEESGIYFDAPAEEEGKQAVRESSSFKRYGSALEDIPEASAEERGRLILEVMAGKQEAVEALVKAFARPIADIARLYAGQGVPAEDLVSEGNIGLISAVPRMDACKSKEEGEAFLFKLVMDSMETAIGEQQRLREMDEMILEKLNRIHQYAREISGELGRRAGIGEVAKEAGMEEAEVRDTILISGVHLAELEDIDGM